MDKERIVLGSGQIYTMVYTPDMKTTLPTDEKIEIPTNELGAISGGATVEYTAEFYTATDDLGRVSKTILTKEDVILKSGIMTFSAKTLEKLSATARIDDTSKPNHRILKIGGVTNKSDEKYLIRFLHKDNADGDVRITIVGENTKGFSLAFVKDKETVIDAEFKASPNLDNEGTLILYDEKLPINEDTEGN